MTDGNEPINPIQRAQHFAKNATVLSAIALVLGLIAFALAGFAWYQLSATRSDAKTTLSTLSKSIQQSSMNSNAGVNDLRGQLQQQRQQLTNLQLRVNKLSRFSQTGQRQETLSFVSYYLQLANLQLQVAHDSKAAQHLLTLAKQSLDKISDSDLMPLKQAINNDLSQFKHIPGIDKTTIIMKLDAINTAIQNLSVTPKLQYTTEPDNNAHTTPATPKHWYDRLIQDMKGLKELVVIRHHRKATLPLLAPQEQRYLKDNIQTKLLQTQAAILNGNETLYANNIKLIQAWVNNYFANSPEKQSIVTELEGLRHINIQATMPTIKNSLDALNTVLYTNAPTQMPSKKQEGKPIEPKKHDASSSTKKQPDTTLKTTPTNPGIEL